MMAFYELLNGDGDITGADLQSFSLCQIYLRKSSSRFLYVILHTCHKLYNIAFCSYCCKWDLNICTSEAAFDRFRTAYT